jgi:hypothetical protein
MRKKKLCFAATYNCFARGRGGILKKDKNPTANARVKLGN